MAKYLDLAALKKAFSLLKGNIDTKVGTKMDKFSIGTGLELKNGTMNVTLDTSIAKIVTALPASPAAADVNKIHFVQSGKSGTNDIYSEYIWLSNKWEKIGDFVPGVDLSPYLTKTDAQNTYAKKDGTGATGTWKISISGLAGTATKLATDRTLTIGSTAKSFDGSGNVAWTLAEIGAAAASHTHDHYVYSFGNDDCDPTSHDGNYFGMTEKSGIDSSWWNIISLNRVTGNNARNKIWASQLALPTQTRRSLRYRTGASASAYSEWVTVLDTSNSGISGNTITINGVSIAPLVEHQSLANYYTKTETDSRYQPKGSYLTGITKAQVEAVLTGNIMSHTHSEYVKTSESLKLGETSSTAYAGDKGKAVTDLVDSIIDSSVHVGELSIRHGMKSDYNNCYLIYSFLYNNVNSGLNIGENSLRLPLAYSNREPPFDKWSGLMSAEDKYRLDGIADNATADSAMTTAEIDAICV